MYVKVYVYLQEHFEQYRQNGGPSQYTECKHLDSPSKRVSKRNDTTHGRSCGLGEGFRANGVLAMVAQLGPQ